MENSYDDQSIAIIGLSCRFPGDADNIERFWNLLREGQSAISTVPGNRWNSRRFQDDKNHSQNTSRTNRAHFLKEDVSAFDANFFSISKSEAESMDPQQRLMLEVSYEAFENAGLAVESLAQSQMGCWVSSFSQDWREMQFSDLQSVPKYAMSGMQPEMLANRVSYFFDLRGPSMALETACSGSLVGLHAACQSLRSGECDAALVGGANLFLNPNMFLALSNQNFLAPDGLSKAFDASANGYGRGEGFAAVILKPVEKAIRDGDPIRAVIRATGTNQDGRTKGLTMPNGDAQETLIRSTYRSAGLELKDTAYFEAHGTGTQVGDFEELSAIARTVADARKREGLEELWVGSAKTNIGHLEATAGLAGVLKAILVLENGVIPPNLHFKNPNPRIPFQEYHIRVPTQEVTWNPDTSRRVSVNSFGFGGSNAHAIIDNGKQYLHQRRSKATLVNGTHATDDKELKPEVPQIFVINSSDQEGLGRQRSALRHYLTNFGKEGRANSGWFRDLAFTLGKKRSRLPWRSFCTASTVLELSEALEATDFPKIRSGTAALRLAYVFTGQGAQWAQMGLELFQFPTFKQSVVAADSHLKKLGCPWSVVEELQRSGAESNIHVSWYSQTLCTVLQVALVELLQSWGITPRSVVGHSSGEMAAAFAIGALAREDAWKIAYWRGKLSSELTERAPELSGAMMAVGASHEQAQKWVEGLTRGKCVVACVNSPSSVTVSGDDAGLDELAAMLKEKEVFARKLKVTTAYHSHHMKVVAEAYLDVLKDVEVRSVPTDGPQMFTSVSETLVNPSDLGASHWVANLVSPVLFSNTVAELARAKTPEDQATGSAVDLMLEIGPHAALRGPVTQILQAKGLRNIEYQSLLSRGCNAIQTILAAVADLICRGVIADIDAVNNAHTPQGAGHKTMPANTLTTLPPYAWNHSRTFWTESRMLREAKAVNDSPSSFIGLPMPSFVANEHIWRGFLRLEHVPWVRHHKMQSAVLFPAGGFLAMAIEGASQFQGKDSSRAAKGYKLRDVRIDSAVILTEESNIEHILQLRPHDTARSQQTDSYDGWWEFKISTSAGSDESLKCNCYGLVAVEFEQLIHPSHASKASSTTVQQAGAFYERLESVGLEYGPSFQAIKTILHSSGGQTEGEIEIMDIDVNSTTPGGLDGRPYVVHPTTLEALFQMAYAAFDNQSDGVKNALLVTDIEELLLDASISHTPGARLQTSARSSRLGFREMLADVTVSPTASNAGGISVRGLTCVEMPSTAGVNSDVDIRGGEGYESMLSKFVWKPALNLLSGTEREQLLIAATKVTDAETEAILAREAADFQNVKSALQASQRGKPGSLKLRNALKWISQQLPDAKVFGKALEKVSQDGQGAGPTGPIVDVLSGTSTPDVLLSAYGSTEKFLAALPGVKVSLQKMSQLVNIMAHENPDLAVLEIGSGSSGEEDSSIFSKTDIPTTIKYTRAVATPEILRNLQESSPPAGPIPRFTVLDLEQDLADQGVDLASFDIIIGNNVLSNSRNVENVLRRIKSLLRDEGNICFVELTKPSSRAVPVLGVVCDWWKRGDDGLRRPLSSDSIKDILTEQGFTLDFLSPDFVDPAIQQSSLVFASSSAENLPTASATDDADDEEIYILISPESKSPDAVVQNVASSFQHSQIVTWGAGVDFKGKYIISLLELNDPFINHLTEEEFDILKKLVTQASSLLWVTGIPEPHASTILGFARVVRFEIPSLDFRVLTLDPATIEDAKKNSIHISQVQRSKSRDKEFQELNSIVHIPRVTVDAPLNHQISNLCLSEAIESKPLGSLESPQKLRIRNPGMLNTLCFQANNVLENELQDDEVEVRVMASGLNSKDVMVALGHITDTHLGLEASGVVLRVGASVTHLQLGDKVVMLANGAHRTTLRGKAAVCQKIPQDMTYEEAAGFPFAYCTAYYTLLHVLRAQSGQSVLIHAAAGAVGQALVRLAQHLGLEVFTTAESADDRAFVQELLGLSPDRIYHPQDKGLVQHVMRITGDVGVDFIVNPLSVEEIADSPNCLADFGTFVEMGMENDSRRSTLNTRVFRRDTTFVAVNLQRVLELRPKLIGEILQKALGLFQDGQVKSVSPSNVYPVSEAEAAIQMFQDNRHHGKITLSYSSEDVVSVLQNPKDSLKLSPDNTYLIAGGLGGIGRSLATLLVNCGARHIAMVSRSGITSVEKQQLIDNLSERGAKIGVYKCSIGDANALGRVLAQCASEMPPIKGIIHSAVVFRDAVFHNMTYKQWDEVLDGKLRGSWNLHALTTSYNLDFFLCIGSFMAIIGGISQSNYAAGGAFQDGLAHLRQSQGLPAVTIDLGIVKGFGAVEEQGAVGHTLEWREPFGVSEPEVHALIKGALLGQRGNWALDAPAQMINSIPTGGMVRSSGVSQPYYFDDPRFSIMAKIGMDSENSDTQASVSLKELLADAESSDDAASFVTGAVISKVAKLMQVAEEEIDIGKSLHAYGVDSLVAVEYVSWAKKEVSADITVFDVMASKPIMSFARDLVGKGKWGAAIPACES